MDIKKHVLLLFPPVWSPVAPYLSTPLLTSYLRSHGISTIQRDLNICYWNYISSSEKIAEIYGKLLTKEEEIQSESVLREHEKRLMAYIAAVKEVGLPRFISEVRSGVIDRSILQTIIHLISNCNQSDHSMSGDYHDPLYWNISFSQHALSSRKLEEIVSDLHNNSFIEFYRKEIAEVLSGESFDIVGISITALNQVVPAFTLAKILKHLNQSIHIVIGGSWCTQVHQKLSPILGRFEYIDSMVVYEGEQTLLKLCKAIREKTDLGMVPNLYFKQGDAVKYTGFIESSLDMNDLPEPIFDGLPLDQYDFKNSLPLQASRGCYWGKCTFCSYKLLEPKYKFRSASKIVADMCRLKSHVNADSFMFTDAAISPSYAKQLSQTILAQNNFYPWVAFARFDKGFTSELLLLMAKSGCQQISWGLESACARILDVIDKSIQIESAETILKESHAAGICNRVLVMYGHPTEQASDAQETVKFVKKHIAYIHSLSWNYYHPEHDTGVEHLADEYSFKLAADLKNDLSFSYQWESELTPKEKDDICNSYRAISNQMYFENEESRDDFLAHITEIAYKSNVGQCNIALDRPAIKKMFSYVPDSGSKKLAKRKFYEVFEI